MKFLRQFLISISILFVACGTNDRKKNVKVFKYNESQNVGSLDPAFASTLSNMWAVTQLFNGLVEVDDELKIHPALAQSYQISGNGTIYTFKLKKGIYFHDHEAFDNGKGREVVASDFVYSYQRILDPKTESRGRWVFAGKVKENEDGTIADNAFEAPDKYTLIIRLKEPFAPFIHLLCMPYGAVVPKEVVEKYGKDFRTHPVGTGPFKFKIWNENTALIFVKNENYWKKDEEGNQLPYLDAVHISFITDENMAFINFKQKKFDFLSGINESSRDLILDHDGNVRKEYHNMFKVQKMLYANTEYLGIQMDSSKYKEENRALLDKRVRQALNYAIDREEFITYLRSGLGTPGTAGIVPYPVLFKHKIKGYYYNPAKATELIKAAGYHKKKLHLKLYTTAPYKQIAEYLQKAWSKVNVELSIEVNTSSTLRGMIDKGEVTFFRGSWIADYLDAENYLALFYSKNYAPQGPNKTRFTSNYYDELYLQAQRTSEPIQRTEIYTEMDQYLTNEAPFIILFYDELIRLTQNNVTNLEPNPLNIIRLERVKI